MTNEHNRKMSIQGLKKIISDFMSSYIPNAGSDVQKDLAKEIYLKLRNPILIVSSNKESHRLMLIDFVSDYIATQNTRDNHADMSDIVKKHNDIICSKLSQPCKSFQPAESKELQGLVKALEGMIKQAEHENDHCTVLESYQKAKLALENFRREGLIINANRP